MVLQNKEGHRFKRPLKKWQKAREDEFGIVQDDVDYRKEMEKLRRKTQKQEEREERKR